MSVSTSSSTEAATAAAAASSSEEPVMKERSPVESPSSGSFEVDGSSSHGHVDEPKSRRRGLDRIPVEQGCQNIPFAFAFLVHLVLLGLIYRSHQSDPESDKGGQFYKLGAFIIILSSIVGILWTLLLLAPEYSTGKMARGSHVAATVLWITFAALLFKYHVTWILGTLCLLFAVGDTLWMVHARQKLKFTTTFLNIISDSYLMYRRLICTGGVLLLLQTVFLLLWLQVLVAVIFSGPTSVRIVFQTLYLLLSLRWTTGIIQLSYTAFTSANFGRLVERNSTQSMDGQHLPVYSVDALQNSRSAEGSANDEEWGHLEVDEEELGGGGESVTNTSAPEHDKYFSEDHVDTDIRALRTALTTNLGSLAAGSLVGFATPFLWAILRIFRGIRSRSRRECVKRCSSVVFAWVERWVRLSHRYTIVMVASKRLPWFRAAKKTWMALSSNGTQAVVSDDCTGRLLQFACYVCGLVACLLGILMQQQAVDRPFLLLMLFTLGFVCMSLPLAVFTGPVKTVIVFFALKPDVVAQWHTVVFHRFMRLTETHQVRFPEDDSGAWMEHATW